MLKAIGLNRIFKDKELLIEGTIEKVWDLDTDPKDTLAVKMGEGNPAAIMAVMREGYRVHDAPFYYCKMGALGYVISKNDFALVDE